METQTKSIDYSKRFNPRSPKDFNQLKKLVDQTPAKFIEKLGISKVYYLYKQIIKKAKCKQLTISHEYLTWIRKELATKDYKNNKFAQINGLIANSIKYNFNTYTHPDCAW